MHTCPTVCKSLWDGAHASTRVIDVAVEPVAEDLQGWLYVTIRPVTVMAMNSIDDLSLRTCSTVQDHKACVRGG